MGCSSGPETVSLTVSITGLPDGVDADVTLTGLSKPELVIQTTTYTVETGDYRLDARSVTDDAQTSYVPDPRAVNFNLGTSSTKTIVYSRGAGPPPELCTGGVDEDQDTFVDCADVSDCACATNCIDLFLEAVDAGTCVSPNLLNNAGFEADPNDPDNWTDGSGFPKEVGPWGGDLASVVDAGPGVTPLEGSSMMQFDSTFDNPEPTASASSERVQLVGTGTILGRRLCGVARFARVAGDPEETDSAFAVVTAYYEGPPSAFDGFESHITTDCFSAEQSFRCGNGPVEIEASQAGSWVLASSTTVLPASGTATALVMVRAQENVKNDDVGDSGPEFDGHFVDDVGLFLVPDSPSSACREALSP